MNLLYCTNLKKNQVFLFVVYLDKNQCSQIFFVCVHVFVL